MLQDLIDTTSLGSIYLLFALGLSLVWGSIGILNFAHGAIFMFSAFLAHEVGMHTRLPMVGLIGIGVVTGAAMSVGVQILAYEPILRRAKDLRSAELQILVAGIGLAGIPLAIAQHETLDNPFGFAGSSFTSRTYHIFGADITTTQVLIIVLGLGLGIGLAVWLKRSRVGLALRAVGVDRETASLMGIEQAWLALGAMAVAGALAGLAGVLLTFDLAAITPESGDTLLIKAFAAVILGGVGSMVGAIVGSYVLAAAETVVLLQSFSAWVDAVSFGLIFVVLLVKKDGLFGRAEVRRT